MPNASRFLIESFDLAPAFVLQVYDGPTNTPQMAGPLQVTVRDRPRSRPFVPLAKDDGATFVFFNLPTGSYTFEVQSPPLSAVYQPLAVAVTVPRPETTYRAFPDARLADPRFPLADSRQTPEYRAQRRAATLSPGPTYPIEFGATVLRGSVRDLHDQPVLHASVVDVDDPTRASTTGFGGEFVLTFDPMPEIERDLTLRVSHPDHLDADHTVTVRRGVATFATLFLFD